MALSFTSTSAAVTSAGASPTGSLFPTASQTSPTFSPDSASIFLCGDRAFRPSEYTCYDGSTLCPVQGGGRFESCGGSCYDPGLYGCVSGGLQPIVDGKFLDGMTPSHTIAVPVTQWPSNVPTPLLSSISSSSPTTSPTSSRTSSTLSTSTRSSSTSSKTSSKSSSTSSSTSSTASSTSSSSSSSSASASASSSSTAAPTRDDDNGNGLSTNQIAAIASSISAAAVIFIMAGFFLFRRHKSQTARASQQVYPELAYLYDPPVPGSENGSRGALPSGASPRTPGGGGGSGEPVGPFGVGGPGGSDGDDDGATGAGATALGATLRGGGGSSDQRSSSPEGRSAGSRSSSVGSVVSFLGPGGRPPVMGEGMAALNGSSSGSSNAALLAASARRDREAGNGSPLAPVPSRSDDENAANGEEARPFLTAAGAVAAGGSSGASSRDRSAERGGAVTTHQRDETALWNGEEMDRELGERLHEQQVEEARQRRERARAFLLQAKERQEQRIPMPSHAPANGESSAGMTAAAAGAAAVGGAAAALASKGQQRNATNPKLQHMQSREQQWWQQPSSPTATSPTQSSGAAFFPPPAATHANQGYYPIYPPISLTYPRSGPILTSQHIEANRLEQVQHARATAAAASSPPTTTTAYPTFHRPGPNNYPAPSNWQQSPNGSYTYTNNGATAAAAAASVRGRPFFHQNTSYVPPHRATIDNYSSLSSPNNNNGFGPIVNAPRRGSAGSIQSGSVYSTIPEEESHPPQRPQQQQQRKQSLQSIMRQMNSLDEEDSEGDEGQGFLQAPRRVLSVRNGAVTPSTDGEEDERDGGARRSGGAKKEVRWARDDGVERNLI
ncbi:Endo-beta-glucanase eng1 [Lasiodiplodia theobromae]|uniref:Endo-beta-glucanase eng1 n=1 Tax=Lasiodiplodia theobromae TaxID=45133 RepID=UPI0015C3F9CE|nr:Endo-beta-glucanase eng1 [Lasiodiplodia theobromae]KAF4546466.1 Endo-beta-glucanase eng1 [Lasiodiplodia theobromae]